MKYNLLSQKYYSLPALGFLVLVCSYAKNGGSAAIPTTAADSSLLKLQSFLDVNYINIDKYYKAKNDLEVLKNEISTDSGQMGYINDSIGKLTEHAAVDFCNAKAKENPLQRRNELVSLATLVARLDTEERQLAAKTEALQKTQLSLDSLVNITKTKYEETKKALNELSPHITGAGALSIGRNNYRFFIALRTEHDIQVHNSKAGPSSIDELNKELSKTNAPLMITNGGMFSPGFSPQGLLIEGGKKMHDLDTLRPEKSNLNFYLLPNGVFSIDAGGTYFINETYDFRRTLSGAKKIPVYATQSGPLMLNNGSINKNFRAASSNVNIRSGVGLIDSGRVVFVISDTPVNFYDFTLVFKEIFQCKNALYLDGAISQMYISEKLLKRTGNLTSGSFGPLVSITQKKKP